MNECVLRKITFVLPLHAREKSTATLEKTDNVLRFSQQNINRKLKWDSKLEKVWRCFIFRVFFSFLKKYTEETHCISSWGDGIGYLCGLCALFNQNSWLGKRKGLFACVSVLPSFIALNRQDAVCILSPLMFALCFWTKITCRSDGSRRLLTIPSPLYMPLICNPGLEYC